MSLVGDAVFRLRQWRVDPALDEISRDGKTVKLEPRTMQVLVCLAERSGEVVSVNQLLDVVWKDLVVTPDSVYQAVAVLRRALGDDPKYPTYIANLLRRGYPPVAPVEVDAQTPDPVRLPSQLSAGTELEEQQTPAKDKLEQLASAPSEGSQIVRRRTGLRYGSILIALLVVAGSALWLTSRLNRERAAADHSTHAGPAQSLDGDV